MPRSIASGDYALMMYVQSGTLPDDWYRVALDRRTRQLSCDCSIWVYNRSGDRSCKHTTFVSGLLAADGATTGAPSAAGPGTVAAAAAPPSTPRAHPYVQAVEAQFPGLIGAWEVAERRGHIRGEAYDVVQLRLHSATAGAVEGTVAFAPRHGSTPAQRLGEVAVRAGYAIGLELAHRRGIDLPMHPPGHFVARPAPSTGAARHPSRGHAAPASTLPPIALDQIVRVAGTPARAATPPQRAEGTLRLMLGDTLYEQLERAGYIDVPSALYAEHKRVYRLRRDPAKRLDRRIRVFEEEAGSMRYVNDYCVVRQSLEVPEADHVLTKWLGLLSDERQILDVVHRHNIFPPYSDSLTPESAAPVWRARGPDALD